MLICNATIESLRAVSGIAGDGRIVLAAESLTHPLPVELIDPKDYRVETDRQRGIRNDAMVQLHRRMLEVAGHTPAVGDRITIKRRRLNAASEYFEVTDVKELAGGMKFELVLMVRDDDPDASAGGGA